MEIIYILIEIGQNLFLDILTFSLWISLPSKHVTYELQVLTASNIKHTELVFLLMSLGL